MMTEPQTSTPPQAGEAPEGQAPTTTEATTIEPQAATTDPATDPNTDDDSGKSAIAKANREAAKYRTELRKAQEQLEAANREKLTDLEKAQADAAKARAEADTAIQARNNALASSAISSAAVAAKFHAPSDAIDLLQSRVEFDEDGQPTNIAALVTELATQRPHLVNLGGPGAGGAPGAASPGAQPRNEKSRSDFLRDFGLAR